MLTTIGLLLCSQHLGATSGYVGHAHLLDRSAQIVFVDDAMPDRPALDSMTRAQLEHEYMFLKEERPSIVFPLIIAGIGAGWAFLGVSLLPWASKQGGSNEAVSVASIVVGGAAVVLGIVWLIYRLHRRTEFDARMDAINQKLDALPAGANPGEFVPPPPPSTQLYPKLPVVAFRLASF